MTIEDFAIQQNIDLRDLIALIMLRTDLEVYPDTANRRYPATLVRADRNHRLGFKGGILVAYPAVNLSAANAIFAAIGIEITKHDLLGYYCATVRGEELKAVRLIDLTHAILKRLNCNN